MTFVHSETLLQCYECLHLSFTLSRQQQICPGMNRISTCKHLMCVCKQDTSAVKVQQKFSLFQQKAQYTVEVAGFHYKRSTFYERNSKTKRQ